MIIKGLIMKELSFLADSFKDEFSFLTDNLYSHSEPEIDCPLLAKPPGFTSIPFVMLVGLVNGFYDVSGVSKWYHGMTLGELVYCLVSEGGVYSIKTPKAFVNCDLMPVICLTAYKGIALNFANLGRDSLDIALSDSSMSRAEASRPVLLEFDPVSLDGLVSVVGAAEALAYMPTKGFKVFDAGSGEELSVDSLLRGYGSFF